MVGKVYSVVPYYCNTHFSYLKIQHLCTDKQYVDMSWNKISHRSMLEVLTKFISTNGLPKEASAIFSDSGMRHRLVI